MTKQQQKAEALHFYYEIKKEGIKASQRLELATTKKEKKENETIIKRVNRALKTLEKYL